MQKNVETKLFVLLLLRREDHVKFSEEAETLKKSAWPKCDDIALRLQSFGLSALPALQSASISRVHHVRSACLRSVYALDEVAGKEMASKFLRDRAYEVRETAANILGVPVPDKP